MLRLIILFTLFSALLSCKKEQVKTQSSFDVKYISEFDNTIYPSLIFGMSEMEKIDNLPNQYFTFSFNTREGSNVKIKILESELNHETVISKNNANASMSFNPIIKWKYEEMKYFSQPGVVDLTFVFYVDDKEEDRKNIKFSYRAINECILSARINGEVIPYYQFLASYVNEDSPVIDGFLKEVLQSTDLNSFVGYSSGKDYVNKQIESVFYTLRNKGTKYSNITNTSNFNSNISSQYIRFSDEVINNSQANCADGTVFFCSVLKKIGIHPVMIIVPEHVYLGYYLDEEKTQLNILETTLVGNYNYSFIDAKNFNIESYNSFRDNLYNNSFEDGYFTIDIDEVRNYIKPIGR